MPKRIRYGLSKDMKRRITRCFPVLSKKFGMLQAWSWEGLTLHLVGFPDPDLPWKQHVGRLRVCKVEEQANFLLELEPDWEAFRNTVRKRLMDVEVKWARIKEPTPASTNTPTNIVPSGLDGLKPAKKKVKVRMRIKDE
jgi:hypothetical protein